MPSDKVNSFFKSRACALTFDDANLETGPAEFAPHEVNFAGRITRNVGTPLPIAGAAMSSVVGVQMAIALAKAGGIGSLPRSMDPEEQAKAVARVKHHVHGFIDEPIPAYADETVESLLRRRAEKGWEFDSFPVLDEKGKFVGLMTHHNFKRCDNAGLLVGSVMTPLGQLVTREEGTTFQDAYKVLKECDKNVLPIMRKDGSVGFFTFADLKRIIDENTTHNIDEKNQLRVAGAVGVGDESLLRAELMVNKGVDVLHIDMAHGAQRVVVETIHRLKEKFRNGPDIMVGNVSNRAGTRYLLDAGVDGIVVGQGGGSICTTRRITGIGKPQLHAVWECAHEAQGMDVGILADGGLRESGDLGKALAAGATCGMVGNLIAGTDEAPGEKHFDGTQFVKYYYGMGSLRAMKESAGSRQRYLHSQGAYVPEGVEGKVPYKGPVSSILGQLAGGLRKTFHYVGARNLDELHYKADFMELSVAGEIESHPHDIAIAAPVQGTLRTT